MGLARQGYDGKIRRQRKNPIYTTIPMAKTSYNHAIFIPEKRKERKKKKIAQYHNHILQTQTTNS